MADEILREVISLFGCKIGWMHTSSFMLIIISLIKICAIHGSTKTSKLRVTGLCEENLPVTNEFPTQMASKRISFDDVIMEI